MRKLLLVGGIGSLLFAALIYPAMLAVTGSAAEVWIVKDPSPELMLKINRALFEIDAPPKDDPSYARMVMEIYGSPLSDPQKVLFVGDRVMHPAEMPELSIVLVGEEHGGNPIEVMSLFFFARWFFGGAAVVGFILLAIACFLAQRRRKAAAAAEAPTEPAAPEQPAG